MGRYGNSLAKSQQEIPFSHNLNFFFPLSHHTSKSYQKHRQPPQKKHLSWHLVTHSRTTPGNQEGSTETGETGGSFIPNSLGINPPPQQIPVNSPFLETAHSFLDLLFR
ncbi:hypothetical protein CDAR_54861 [Caerostris darwini]|uniref:Uncharacterized protein n=1 Tax=Caerostris darwini TaxID=1538125 RepID=A0AAV4ND39_9ARAC|nr:hypothetical protein CDAR_54861 [Caerostris darwini]